MAEKPVFEADFGPELLGKSAGLQDVVATGRIHTRYEPGLLQNT